jgi:hypothetical protein
VLRIFGGDIAAATHQRARQRIELFGDNMRVFHYHLRKAGCLDEPEQSVFYLSDEGYTKFIDQPAPKGRPLAWYLMKRANPLPPAEPR